MRAVIFAGFFLLSVGCLAESLSPSEVEASFATGLQSLPALVAQEQYQRRLADILLGLHVSSNFAAYGHYHAERYRIEESLPVYGPEVAPAGYQAQDDSDSDDVEEDDSDSDEFPSLLGLKEEFIPFPGMFGAQPQQQPQPQLTLQEAAKLCHVTKVSALRGLHLQLYLAAHDVNRSYWTNKIIIALSPSQLAVFKVYKSYLNTLALSLAYQLHDTFSLEAILEDFNAHHAAFTTEGRQIESRTEAELFSKWYQLALIKWQLYMLGLYESYSYAQFAPAPAPAAAAPAPEAAAPPGNSFVEVDSKFMPAQDPASAMATYYAYVSYYLVFLKYYALFSELQLAQSGAYAAQLKLQFESGSIQFEATKTLHDLETKTVPALFQQWGSINQMKFQSEYFLFFFEMYNPALLAAKNAEHAENPFQNLVQTEAPAEKTN